MQPLYIGIDAGGTKTEWMACAGKAEAGGRGAGVNLQRDGAERSTEVLAGLITDALAALDYGEVGGVCLGVAGAGREEDQADLADRLRSRLPEIAGVPLVVEHDGLIALEAAFGGESGLVALVGTGSLVLARTEDGTVLRAGGWGARIGDPASGTALGTAVLAAVAADFDGGEPTALRHLLAEQHGLASPEALIRAVYREGLAVQTLAPLAVAAGESHDWVGTRILKTQANALAQRAAWLVAQAEDDHPTGAGQALTPRLVLTGGMTQEPYYRECLAEAFLRHLPRWRIVRPERRPVHGAVSMAQRALS